MTFRQTKYSLRQYKLYSVLAGSLSNRPNYKIKKPYYLTDNHKEFYEALLKPQTRIGFVDGPAGSAKSYLAVLAGLELLEKGGIDNILYIRSVIESASKSIGALPGELDEKFSPYVAPMMEKVCEIIGESSAAMLKSRDVLAAIPVNFVRGLTFTNSFVIRITSPKTL